ncbi:MAG: hypothetical protein JGK17_30090 [Microcoleus sp. PH2017_10_PVI_O_A]|nr:MULTISPECIES: hypothetical protein [unclassified Microcoleus]MCC3409725.1 hypothetical protein [Microcoleus sp. PH2017_10_PVI_O_A]MCC3463991.1 hypothetical protein [Microcoleus sp. PH2017_11_PCY_U_A]MCC3482323.1 hypothetical protein [Microcoleus sp. PH2017_12_PCY_D_A]MCC3532174.1 hypothetical protein [Microcoleus sp. PH2017_21_RUC_O_A]MCC3544489.1 hypothetical protein [Microcoleus sp. PH2017_22_RUC_O_B]
MKRIKSAIGPVSAGGGFQIVVFHNQALDGRTNRLSRARKLKKVDRPTL